MVKFIEIPKSKIGFPANKNSSDIIVRVTKKAVHARLFSCLSHAKNGKFYVLEKALQDRLSEKQYSKFLAKQNVKTVDIPAEEFTEFARDIFERWEEYR